MHQDLICERVDLCQKGENPYLIHEFENSYFVIGDHQFYKGYSLLLFKRHVRELHELSVEEYLALSKELHMASNAIVKTFNPWKMNQQCLGNKDQHVHWHIIPRYESDKYHRTFPFTDYMKGEMKLSDHLISHEEARELASLVRSNLIEPKGSRVLKTLNLDVGTIVLEDLTNLEGSNLYLLNKSLETIWSADLPHESDYFTGVQINEGGTILCSTWNGLTCEISKREGKILSKRDSR